MIMTIEEKAKAYDEAIEKLRSLHDDYDTVSTLIDIKEELENIFPELKESEDERTSREITEFLVDFNNGEYERPNENTIDSWLSWLEKQGTPAKLSEEEQNRFAKGVLTSCAMSFIDYLDAHKYEGKMCVSNGECEDIENAFRNAMWDRLHRYYCKYVEKQGEQKPTWGEDDEKIFGRICALIHSAAYKNYDIDEDGNECGEYANIKEWFKKLKDRVQLQTTWKPSDEQMADLWNMLCECRPADHQLLQDIYYGLKKLREK